MQACACALFALGAACAVDDLDRLGAGRASINSAPATDPQLGDRLRPDNSLSPVAISGDAGAAPIDTAGRVSDGPELLPNPSFEAGHEGWVGFGSSRILDVVAAHRGSRAILSTNRLWPWEGPSYDIQPLVVATKPYAVSAWVRNEVATHTIMLTLKTSCDDETSYTRLATRVVTTDWQQLDASFLAPECEDLEELSLYIEGPPEYENLMVDDVSLRAITLTENGESSDEDDDDQGDSNRQ